MKRLLFVCAALFFGFSVCAFNALQAQEASSDEHMRRLSKPLPYLAQIFGSVTEIKQEGPLLILEDVPTQGSAFVYIDEKGRCGVYTANHLMGASEKTAWVRMDGEKTAVEVSVVSRDFFFDIAVFECPKIPGKMLGSVTLGSAEDVFIGRVVYTVGFSKGRRSVTRGYVNSVNSPLGVPPYLFSHQSPIQQGDSGGLAVVFNDKDEPIVVGMNTGVSPGGLRSYSISARYLRRITAHLWEMRRGFDGLTFGAVVVDTSDIPPQYYVDSVKKPYPPPSDVVVVKVGEGTPAESAGLKEGDAIVSVQHPDGAKISFASAGELMVEIFFHASGETILFSVIRDGKPLDVAVTLRAREEE